jgi:hypothetical protein
MPITVSPKIFYETFFSKEAFGLLYFAVVRFFAAFTKTGAAKRKAKAKIRPIFDKKRVGCDESHQS